MSGGCYKVADAAVVAADGAADYFPVATAQGVLNCGPWRQVVALVDLDVGAGVESVLLALEVSPNGVDWFTTTVFNLLTAADKFVQVAGVTRTADTVAAVLACDNGAPYVRLVATNNGANAAILTAWLCLTN